MTAKDMTIPDFHIAIGFETIGYAGPLYLWFFDWSSGEGDLASHYTVRIFGFFAEIHLPKQ
jgi:hypothetical protein